MSATLALVLMIVTAAVLSRARPDAAQADRSRSGPVVKDPDAFAVLSPGASPDAPLPNETPITAPDHFDEAAAPAEPPPAALSRFRNVKPSGGTWAVMIGINDYPGSSHDLRSAVADVRDVDEALGRMGVPADHRMVITDRQANAATIKLSVDWLNAHAGPDAVAVFFYAGHVRKISGNTEAILAADGAAITDADLGHRLRGLKAHKAWIAIAACYGGGFVETLAPGRVLTGAAPAHQLAYENSAFGRSYMVQFMIREAMLDGRAAATVQTAFDYANAALARQYPGREPVQVDHGTTPLDLRPPGAVARQSPPTTAAPQPPPPPAPKNSTTTTTAPKCQGVPNPLGVRCN
jgi:Caspase domain